MERRVSWVRRRSDWIVHGRVLRFEHVCDAQSPEQLQGREERRACQGMNRLADLGDVLLGRARVLARSDCLAGRTPKIHL
jgi:hypothetical protein